MPKLEFPQGFLWGAATSSHQVEGSNHNDWSEWEKQNAERLAHESEKTFAWNPRWKKFKEEATDPACYISGQACDHYNRFREDFDLAKELGHNAHRFSIEWSRIEPEEGKFDEKEIEHYRQVLIALRERNIEPFVTLWHWTNPLWIETHYGGWENPEVGEKFLRFAEKIVSEYKDTVHFWAIFNEPNTFVGRGYVLADRPPARRSFWRAHKATKNFNQTHKKVYAMIHRLQPNATVILSHWFAFMRPYKNQFLSRLAIPILNYFRNGQFFRGLKNYCDAIGVQFYRVDYIRVAGWGAWGPVAPVALGIWQNDLGWDLEPEAIQLVLEGLKKYQKPIYITESGLADSGDVNRSAFIQKTLSAVHRAISNGVPVKGYFHWSLLDNFEWSEGYWPRFGLVAIDFATQKRTPRPSALAYAKICKENALEI
jgi:beta-glucosidase